MDHHARLNRHGLLSRVFEVGGNDRLTGTEPRGLVEPTIGSGDTAQFTGKSDLAQGDDALRHRLVARCRSDGERSRQIRCRIAYLRSTDSGNVDIAIAEPQTAALLQHGEHHGNPSGLDAVHNAARLSKRRFSDQRLYLGKQRTASLHRDGHRSTRHRFAML